MLGTQSSKFCFKLQNPTFTGKNVSTECVKIKLKPMHVPADQ